MTAHDPRMRYAATCEDCRSNIRFPDRDSRADWVGKHRVRTGHTVKQWEIEDQ